MYHRNHVKFGAIFLIFIFVSVFSLPVVQGAKSQLQDMNRTLVEQTAFLKKQRDKLAETIVTVAKEGFNLERPRISLGVANIFLELVQLPEMKKPMILEIFNTICDKIKQPSFKFPGDEVEFLAGPIGEILAREILMEEEVLDYLEKLKIEPHHPGQSSDDYFRLINVRNFLRAIYFYLLDFPEMRRPRDLLVLALQDLKSS